MIGSHRCGGFTRIVARKGILGFMRFVARNRIVGFTFRLARNSLMGFIMGVARIARLGFICVMARHRNYTFSAASAARNCAGVTTSWFSIDPAYGADTGSPIISIHFMYVRPRNSFVVLRFAR